LTFGIGFDINQSLKDKSFVTQGRSLPEFLEAPFQDGGDIPAGMAANIKFKAPQLTHVCA
jgi:hypothetical protein